MNSKCDLWEAGKNAGGYGKKHVAYLDGKQIEILAHRLVWQQDNGHTDLMVLHSCDTPACINIEHLRAGTAQDNIDDRTERGRQNNGRAERTHCSKGHEFTPENTYLRSTGGRKCNICIAEHNKNRR